MLQALEHRQTAVTSRAVEVECVSCVLVSEPGLNPARTADVDNEPVRWGLEIKHVTALSHLTGCHQSIVISLMNPGP
jgi:hypothetical protein